MYLGKNCLIHSILVVAIFCMKYIQVHYSVDVAEVLNQLVEVHVFWVWVYFSCDLISFHAFWEIIAWKIIHPNTSEVDQVRWWSWHPSLSNSRTRVTVHLCSTDDGLKWLKQILSSSASTQNSAMIYSQVQWGYFWW